MRSTLTFKVHSYLIILSTLFTPSLSFDTTSWSSSSATRPDSTRTSNAGPLTTVFTPPASCFTPHTSVYYGIPYLLQGVDGPNGDDCAPEGWKFDRYYSPGQCPSGYKACTLPTVTQRVVTTEICCPSGFDCMFQDYCAKTFNSPSTITYSDSTISIKTSVWAATASAIQIRFQASDSSVVPVPTESFKLPMPKKELSTREKAGIGIGAAAGAVLLGLGGVLWVEDLEEEKIVQGFGERAGEGVFSAG
ncbi:hypothetical protein N7481_008712 [Penicillium waksmanii]|uniref:uncharacterized protein n=1 Tax=Penicillium waksmanii TaxID=69791 RepID=UPI0025483534|nr:uncharacterized protein N7481_008712 [Penicillium waksmanii]KAJ5975005.1 hypothetical protein N7481_008712 [Penicillium waksmanii]